MLPSPVSATHPRKEGLRFVQPTRRLLRFFPWFLGGIVIVCWFIWYSDLPPTPWGPPPPPPSPPPPPPPTIPPPLPFWEQRAEAVKAAFVHAFNGYWEHARGYDELYPVTGSGVNNFAGWGITLHDSLDTMWIMGLRDTFHESLAEIRKTRFHLKEREYAAFFETVIRHLGGLLSAYALSGEEILLLRADDLGRMLLPAFDTPSGLPMFSVNTVTGKTKAGWAADALWAEVMSNQMEYKYLAQLTGREEYYNKTENVMKLMHETPLRDGLFPSRWSHAQGTPTDLKLTVGAFADSAYEYLLKQWLLTSQSEPRALEMYLKSAKGIINNLLHITPERQLLYVTDTTSEDLTPSRTLEHLSCFLPGLLALGVHTLPDSILPESERELHMWAAEGLAETCWATYADTETGLGADEVRMVPFPEALTNTADAVNASRWVRHVEGWEKEGRPGGRPPGTKLIEPESDKSMRDWTSYKKGYYLRPETIESSYILWRTTGEPRWRERGWEIFESIEKYCKTQYGYASIVDVDSEEPAFKNEMPSFFLAETLKYLYLLFKDEDLLPLDKWVFNTEAHPLPIFEWSAWEKEKWGIGTLGKQGGGGDAAMTPQPQVKPPSIF